MTVNAFPKQPSPELLWDFELLEDVSWIPTASPSLLWHFSQLLSLRHSARECDSEHEAYAWKPSRAMTSMKANVPEPGRRGCRDDSHRSCASQNEVSQGRRSPIGEGRHKLPNSREEEARSDSSWISIACLRGRDPRRTTQEIAQESPAKVAAILSE
jgi:hypothetical protein